jgi:hypothetical protein
MTRKRCTETLSAQWLGYEALGRSVVPDGVLLSGLMDLAKAMRLSLNLLPVSLIAAFSTL